MDAVYPNIENLYQFNQFGLHIFEGSAPLEAIDNGFDRSICINPRDGYAYLTDDSSTDLGFDNIVTEFMSIFGMLRPPDIAEPGEETFVDERGAIIQIGTPLTVQDQVYTVTLDCDLENSGPPFDLTYEWTKDGAVIPNNNFKYRFSDSGDRVTIFNIEMSDAGAYSCTVMNGFSSDSATSVVTISEIPTPEPTMMTTPPEVLSRWLPQSFTPVC